MNSQNKASKLNKIWGLSSAHFDFGKSIRKSKTMVQLQVAMSAIAKSRLQIKPKPVKGSSTNTILNFFMAKYQGATCHIAGSKRSQSIIKIQDLTNKSREGVSLLHTRGMWRLLCRYKGKPCRNPLF